MQTGSIQLSSSMIEAYKKRMPTSEAEIPIHRIPSTAKGFADLSPNEQIIFSKWKQIIQENCELYGFNPFDVSPFVHRKFLLLKGGIDSQVFSVNHLSDNSMTKYGLAFDRTVPFALWVRDHLREIAFPFKRYDINLSYRAELQTKTGRLNGFYQADVDIVGNDLSLSCDAECITTLVSTLHKLSIPSFEVHINHIEIPKQLIKNAGFIKQEEALRIIDKLDKTPANEIEKELQDLDSTVSAETIKTVVKLCSFKGNVEDFSDINSIGKARKYFEQIQEVIKIIKAQGFNTACFKFTPGVVRGLDYYTGIVFETFLNDYPNLGSISSGGRYNELVDVFSEKLTGIQGVGGSIGLSRLFQILKDHPIIPKHIKSSSEVLVLLEDKHLFKNVAEVATLIRNQGIKTDVYSGNASGNLKKQLRYAHKNGIPFAVMVMHDQTYIIRDLTKAQQTNNIPSPKEVADKIVKILQLSKQNISIDMFADKSKLTLDLKDV